MRVALGSDHGGFELKESMKENLKSWGIEFVDFGCHDRTSCDYPVYAGIVAREVAAGNFDYGILFCGTGIGISIAANKVAGIRAACCHDCYSAKYARLHNDANILALGGRVIGAGLACEIANTFLFTGFEGGRHSRRILLIDEIERNRKG
jgi:ribose 5-phosphate isomerase B